MSETPSTAREVRFRVEEEPPTSGQLRYRRDEYGLDFEPAGGGGRSLLVNDVQLEISAGNRVLHVWGLCPHPGWQATDQTPQLTRRTALQVADLPQLISGASLRLNQVRWPVYWNADSGWLWIAGAESSPTDDLIEFADGCVAVLRGGLLVGLWLQPAMT